MLRSATEVLRSLETRIARLESRIADSYDDEEEDIYDEEEEAMREEEEQRRGEQKIAMRAINDIKGILKSARLKNRYQYHDGLFQFKDRSDLIEALHTINLFKSKGVPSSASAKYRTEDSAFNYDPSIQIYTGTRKVPLYQAGEHGVQTFQHLKTEFFIDFDGFSFMATAFDY